MTLKIYFCGSIRGGRQDGQLYAEIIAHLKTFGTVLTEHVGSEDLLQKGGWCYLCRQTIKLNN